MAELEKCFTTHIAKSDVITMTEEQAGRLLNAVETMSRNIERMASDIHQQGEKINKIETVLFDENVGILKDFKSVAERLKKTEDYIIKQETKTALVAAGTVGLLGALWKLGTFLFSAFSHIPK